MSHISKIELEVKDLEALRRACSRLGLNLVKGQKTFQWYGKAGKCDHTIKIPDASYEIGISKAGEKYELLCDYFDRGIEKAIGTQGGMLKQAYAAEKTKAEARRKGYTVIEKNTETGIRLHVRMT